MGLVQFVLAGLIPVPQLEKYMFAGMTGFILQGNGLPHNSGDALAEVLTIECLHAEGQVM